MNRTIFQTGVLGIMLSVTMACGGGTSQTEEQGTETESMTEGAMGAMENAAETAGEAMQGAAETAGEAIEGASMQFQGQVEAKLTTIQKGIENLKMQAGEYGDDAAQQANQVLGPLTQQSQAIQKDLEGLKDESGESMEQMQAGIEAAVAELERAYQEARTKLQP